ncbi:heat stress transcription factor A-2 [Dendrobium catenatum]|uniref:Heat stress transcription factor A-2 n=1 Tax=Dendrobium catenatum TaxID=906689 RepID=A0A2I0X3Q7_9ASPA|nr:heat stress transcription factor A-2 [Dendrobium catenatum]PKU82540.1 Heat stress transcription factor A-2 [Dendrobium catenatum]
MDELVMVKEEAEVTDDPPQPIIGLNDLGPPPFLMKIFEMVEDPETDTVVSWSSAKNSFIVWDSFKFSTTLLPKYFKHSNFSSFNRQLNTYGFRKVDPDRWEFANEKFLCGHRHLLKEIKRRRQVGQTSQLQNPSQQQSEGAGRRPACVELGQFGYDFEVDRLRRDRGTLLAEIAKLRQQHQNSQAQLLAMEERIEGTERKQRNTMAFMARALNNPIFIQQLIVRSQGKNKRSEALQTVEELEMASEIESILGAERSTEAVFGPYGEEIGEMSNVMWELMNAGMVASGLESDVKAESFGEGSMAPWLV